MKNQVDNIFAALISVGPLIQEVKLELDIEKGEMIVLHDKLAFNPVTIHSCSVTNLVTSLGTTWSHHTAFLSILSRPQR